jgi:hypothetical protein
MQVQNASSKCKIKMQDQNASSKCEIQKEVKHGRRKSARRKCNIMQNENTRGMARGITK